MTTWRYIKGNEKDFEGAPDEATIVTIDNMCRKHFGDVFPVPGAKYWSDLGGKGEWGNGVKSIRFEIIAQREPVESSRWVYYLGTPEMFAWMSKGVTHLFRSKLSGVITGVGIRESGECFKDTMKELIGHRGDQSVSPVATNDVVNHPSHYTQGGIECIDAITAATVGKTGIEAVAVANVVKYLWRYEEKNGLEDVKKARWYLERLIGELEGK